jgi:hypothetical protein
MSIELVLDLIEDNTITRAIQSCQRVRIWFQCVWLFFSFSLAVFSSFLSQSLALILTLSLTLTHTHKHKHTLSYYSLYFAHSLILSLSLSLFFSFRSSFSCFVRLKCYHGMSYHGLIYLYYLRPRQDLTATRRNRMLRESYKIHTRMTSIERRSTVDVI